MTLPRWLAPVAVAASGALAAFLLVALMDARADARALDLALEGMQVERDAAVAEADRHRARADSIGLVVDSLTEQLNAVTLATVRVQDSLQHVQEDLATRIRVVIPPPERPAFDSLLVAHREEVEAVERLVAIQKEVIREQAAEIVAREAEALRIREALGVAELEIAVLREARGGSSLLRDAGLVVGGGGALFAIVEVVRALASK